MKQTKNTSGHAFEDRLVRTDHLFCSAEWHFRDTPRAALIYGLALHLAEDRQDGKRYFWLSVRQVAKYFGWNKSTVIRNEEFLKRHGFFRTRKKGGGNEATCYQVFIHSEIGPAMCKTREVVALMQDPSSHTLDHERSEDATAGVADAHLGDRVDATADVAPKRTDVTSDSTIESPKDLTSEPTYHPPNPNEEGMAGAPFSKSKEPKFRASEILAHWMSDVLTGCMEARPVPTARDVEKIDQCLAEEHPLIVMLAFAKFLCRPKGLSGLSEPYSLFLLEWPFLKRDAHRTKDEASNAGFGILKTLAYELGGVDFRYRQNEEALKEELSHVYEQCCTAAQAEDERTVRI